MLLGIESEKLLMVGGIDKALMHATNAYFSHTDNQRKTFP